MKESYSKNPGDFEIKPEQVQQDLEYAKILLESLDVRNLTNIEIGSLRRDVELAYKNQEYFFDKYLKKGKNKAYKMNAISPYQEAVSRFLAHYGIDIDQIDGRRQRDPVFNQIMFDEAAREYIKPRLRKAREKAHKPFLD